MNRFLTLCFVAAYLFAPSTLQAQDSTDLPAALDEIEKSTPALSPFSMDNIDSLTSQALKANDISTTQDAASDDLKPTEEIDTTPEKITSPIQGWGSSLMFNISDRRKLQDVLDALERRRRLLAQQGQNATDDTASLDQEGDFFGDLLEQIQGEVEDLQDGLNNPEPAAPDDTIVTDDGTTVIGNVAPTPTIQEPSDNQAGTQTYQTERGPIRAPNMFLNSILYKSPTQWLIWMNDKQLTQDSANLNAISIEDVSIVRITPTKMIMQWNTDDLDRILPADKSAWPTHRQLIINESAGTVQLILYPNQAFLGRQMDITEGRPSIIPEPKQHITVPNRRRGLTGQNKKNSAGSAGVAQTGAANTSSPKGSRIKSDKEIMNQAIRLYEGLGDHGKKR